MPTLETERLILRRWRESDREPFAALNADPAVCEFFPVDSFSREQSDALIDRIEEEFETHGFGCWAVQVKEAQVKEGSPLIGFVGLFVPTFEAHFIPCVEIGWRLAREAWGQGYASEAAREVLRFSFEEGGLEALVSMTTVQNTRSRAVMERLGFRRDPAEDFDHPNVPPESPLVRHVLYRLSREEWQASQQV